MTRAGILNQRLDRVRRQLSAQRVDCLALVPGSNLRYLTGMNFLLQERAFVVFIPVDGEPVLVIPSLEVPNWRGGSPFGGQLFAWDDSTGPEEAMRRAAATLSGVSTVAVEDLRMRALEFGLVRRHLPDAALVRAEAVMDPVRMVKDSTEIAAIRRAAQICEAALEEVVSGTGPGLTEREVANRLSSAMLLRRGELVSVEPLVLGGARSAIPHATPSDRPIERGEILLIDFVAVVGGYNADITRTFVMGQENDARLREVYQAVQAANAVGRDAARPGVTCHEVDRAVRSSIAAAGFGEHFIHRTGHGLGLDVHESPSVVAGNETLLEPGMVFTIEPGIYLEGWGGVRIEDDVVVTATGCESLTTFGRELRPVGT